MTVERNHGEGAERIGFDYQGPPDTAHTFDDEIQGLNGWDASEELGTVRRTRTSTRTVDGPLERSLGDKNPFKFDPVRGTLRSGGSTTEAEGN